jgi:hypothetical protein
VNVQLLGAAAFGALVGWFIYFINRYRTGGVGFSDLVTLIGVIGGAGVLKLFDTGTDLFGAYGIGLAIGFFGYFLVLVGLVYQSPNFTADWFLDGRRKRAVEPWWVPEEVRQTAAALEVEGGGNGSPAAPAASTPAATRERHR